MRTASEPIPLGRLNVVAVLFSGAALFLWSWHVVALLFSSGVIRVYQDLPLTTPALLILILISIVGDADTSPSSDWGDIPGPRRLRWAMGWGTGAIAIRCLTPLAACHNLSVLVWNIVLVSQWCLLFAGLVCILAAILKGRTVKRSSLVGAAVGALDTQAKSRISLFLRMVRAATLVGFAWWSISLWLWVQCTWSWLPNRQIYHAAIPSLFLSSGVCLVLTYFAMPGEIQKADREGHVWRKSAFFLGAASVALYWDWRWTFSRLYTGGTADRLTLATLACGVLATIGAWLAATDWVLLCSGSIVMRIKSMRAGEISDH